MRALTEDETEIAHVMSFHHSYGWELKALAKSIYPDIEDHTFGPQFHVQQWLIKVLSELRSIGCVKLVWTENMEAPFFGFHLTAKGLLALALGKNQ